MHVSTVRIGDGWFKQIPHERLLAWNNSDLMGNVVMDFRVVRVGEGIMSVLGSVNLCVAPAVWRKKESVSRCHGKPRNGQEDSRLCLPWLTILYQLAGYSWLHAPERKVSGHRQAALPRRGRPQPQRDLHGQAVDLRCVV